MTAPTRSAAVRRRSAGTARRCASTPTCRRSPSIDHRAGVAARARTETGTGVGGADRLRGVDRVRRRAQRRARRGRRHGGRVRRRRDRRERARRRRGSQECGVARRGRREPGEGGDRPAGSVRPTSSSRTATCRARRSPRPSVPARAARRSTPPIECSGAVAAIEAAIELTAPGRHDRAGRHPRAGNPGRLRRRTRCSGAAASSAASTARSTPTVTCRDRPARPVAATSISTRQVSAVWPLAEIESAIAAVRAGEVVRAVLDHTA